MLSLAGTLQAQSATGQITGTVKDATGAVIAGVPVTVSSQLTGITRTTKSNDAGGYSFPLLPVSVYNVTADQKGFRAAKRSANITNPATVGQITSAGGRRTVQLGGKLQF